MTTSTINPDIPSQDAAMASAPIRANFAAAAADIDALWASAVSDSSLITATGGDTPTTLADWMGDFTTSIDNLNLVAFQVDTDPDWIVRSGNVWITGSFQVDDTIFFNGRPYFETTIIGFQDDPATTTTSRLLTATELADNCIITATGVSAPTSLQMPTGSDLINHFTDIMGEPNHCFDFFIINTGTGATTDVTLTVNTDVTIVGNPTVGSKTDGTIISGSGHFRARNTTDITWIVYRLA